jgi:hypothetical protein
MATLGRHIPRPTLRHRIGAAVALFAYLAAAIGLPLPATSVARKDRSQPFPCQDHVCGCQTAEECWASCCCFSPEERWAWAAAHNVQPPEYAERPAVQGWRTTRLRDREGETAATDSTCYGHKHAAHGSCCSKTESAQSPTCCHRDSAAEESSATFAPTDKPLAVHWALGMSRLRCKGLTVLWVGNGAVLLPPAADSKTSSLPLLGRLPYRDRFPYRVNRTPPTPPPRSLFA